MRCERPGEIVDVPRDLIQIVEIADLACLDVRGLVAQNPRLLRRAGDPRTHDQGDHSGGF